MQRFSKLNFFITFLFLFILVGFVRYTPDWEIYEYLFSFDTQIKELFFHFTQKFVKSFGGEFKDLHIIFTTLTSLLFLFFISRFTSNIFLVVLLFLPSIFVFYTTQIRFYLAFFFMINAFYFFFVEKRKFLIVLFVVLAILNHYSIIFLLPFFHFFKLTLENSLIKLFAYLLIILFIFIFFQGLIGNYNNFETYLDEDNESTILGSLFNFMPYILSLFLVDKYYKKFILSYSKNPNIKILFLLKMSYLPYLYLPLAFQYQIIGHRFIYSVFLFQILLVIYTNHYFNLSRYRKNIYKMILFIILHLIYVYSLPFLFWGQSIRLENLIMIISSNQILNFL